jgi:hypothetical protein
MGSETREGGSRRRTGFAGEICLVEVGDSDYYASGNYEGLQGVKDPRGLVGMAATRKRGPLTK